MTARIVVTEFVSLDGVMEAPGGEPDFKYPAWTFEFDRGDDGNRFKLEETRSADALLLGRRTYDSFAGAWPQREGEFADKINAMPKYVVSTTTAPPRWSNSTLLGDDWPARVASIKRAADGDVVVYGSGTLVRELLAHDLVDELRLVVFPVVLGAGDRLFGSTSAPKPLRLLGHRTLGSGLAFLNYSVG
jgi:dihydrofolate reductase